MDKTEFDVVAERLTRLERQCRISRWTLTAAVICLAVCVTALAVRRNDSPREIRAEALSIVDTNGRELIRMGYGNPDGCGLIEFLDVSGAPRMMMGVANTSRPFVRLISRDGQDELVLDAGDQRGAGITLKNLKRDSGLMLATSPDGIAGLGIMSPGGRLVLDMGVKPDDSARFVIRDTEGKELLRLPER